MARKRGGLAGLYDRNKGVIRMLAPAVVGAIPGLGPLAAAGLGAAMRGLDREGKSGIGFDVKQGIRGGLEGYGMGKLGKGARMGITKMFAPKAAAGAAADAAGASAAAPSLDVTNVPGVGMGLGGAPTSGEFFMAAEDKLPSLPGRTFGLTNTARDIAQPPVGPRITAAPIGGLARQSVDSEPGKFTKALDFLTKYEKPLGGTAKAVMGQLPSERDVIDRQTMQLNQQRFDEEMRRQRLQEERMNNMAQLLIPLLRQQMAQPQPRTLAEYLQGR